MEGSGDALFRHTVQTSRIMRGLRLEGDGGRTHEGGEVSDAEPRDALERAIIDDSRAAIEDIRRGHLEETIEGEVRRIHVRRILKGRRVSAHER